MRLEGKRAIITGGGRGIGLACARRFVAEGATIVIGDILRDEGAKVAEELGATFMPCDVTDSAQADDFVARAIKALGGVDILFNNAGVIGPGTPMLETTEEEFRRIMEINVFGAFRIAQSVARHMVDRGISGVIVNTASMVSTLANPDQVAYVSSKHAIHGMTKAMALALAPHGIRVNAIGPGTIKTAVADAVLKNDQAYRRVLSRIPLRYIGDPEDVVGSVVFLASDESAYVTGQIIYPDGGRLALNHVVPVRDAARGR
jgi:glucose 1-dehydrogenase